MLAKSRIKMKANDILTSSETNTNEAIALGIEINKQVRYPHRLRNHCLWQCDLACLS
jgi:hypothetical protein